MKQQVGSEYLERTTEKESTERHKKYSLRKFRTDLSIKVLKWNFMQESQETGGEHSTVHCLKEMLTGFLPLKDSQNMYLKSC